eukprot:gene14279-6871_t
MYYAKYETGLLEFYTDMGVCLTTLLCCTLRGHLP